MDGLSEATRLRLLELAVEVGRGRAATGEVSAASEGATLDRARRLAEFVQGHKGPNEVRPGRMEFLDAAMDMPGAGQWPQHTLTPLEADLLLWVYARAEDPPAVKGERGWPGKEAVERFLNAGMFRLADQPGDPSGCTYALTPRGRRHVDAMLSLPLPADEGTP